MKPDLLIVGSGLFGLTIARRYVETYEGQVLILERRNHLGGNAWSIDDPETGIEYHKYGSHLFHTSNSRVIEFVSRFTQFNDYRHTVYSKAKGKTYSMPFNLMTLSQVYEKALNPKQAKEIIDEEVMRLASSLDLEKDSLEKKAILSVGKTLYDLLIRDYTKKQWQVEPSQLPASVISRLPVRFNFDNSYFFDSFQGLPLDGYAQFLNNLAEHPRIKIEVDTDYFLSKWKSDSDILKVFTGPLDRYFDFKHGELTWRTLDFEIETLDCGDFQGTSVMNYADLEVPYTRIHEFRHLHPERKYRTDKTLIMKEFSRLASQADEPYYPVNSVSDREKLDQYRKLADAEPNVIFGGRLGSYKYLDMDMAIASALVCFENEIVPLVAR